MNQNIICISKNLYAVDFHYLREGYIKEFSITCDNADEFVVKVATITNDGKLFLNAAVNYAPYASYAKAIMQLPQKDLYTKKGFCKVIRKVIPKSVKMTDKEIIQRIMGDDKLSMNWTIYENICKWEVDRRKTEKNFKKMYPVHTFIEMMKGGKTNG